MAETLYFVCQKQSEYTIRIIQGYEKYSDAFDSVDRLSKIKDGKMYYIVSCPVMRTVKSEEREC